MLRLVAGGWTNQQIADALFIARKTASVHVSNILGKLGVDSRVEAGGHRPPARFRGRRAGASRRRLTDGASRRGASRRAAGEPRPPEPDEGRPCYPLAVLGGRSCEAGVPVP